MIKEDGYKKIMSFVFSEFYWLFCEGKGVLWCSRCKIHFYVAAPVLFCSSHVMGGRLCRHTIKNVVYTE
jgi:hypothetical protein